MTELRRDFLDDETWRELAKRFYTRLPVWKTPVTDEKILKYLRKYRITETEYLRATGYKKLSDFARLNPDWPLRAFVGLLLEYVAEKEDAKDVLRAYDRE